VQVPTVTMVFVDNDSSSEHFTGFCDQLKLHMNCIAILLIMFVSLSLKCERKIFFLKFACYNLGVSYDSGNMV